MRPSTSTLHRMISCLSLLVLVVGQASSQGFRQTPTPPPPPLTPAQERYADWMTYRAGKAEPLTGEPTPAEATSQLAQLTGCDQPPSKEFGTVIAFSGIASAAYWNEDIFLGHACSGAVQVTRDYTEEFEPRLNHDGSSTVFVSNRNSYGQVNILNIYAFDGYGDNLRRLTSTPGIDRMPSFSPDDQKIAFVSNRAGNAEIFIMNRDGSSPTQLTFSSEIDVDPDWSPDGLKIAWVKRLADNTGVLSLMDTAGGSQQALLPPLKYMGRPFWSPNGKKIAFHADFNEDNWIELGIVNADGTGLTILPVATYDEYVDLEMGGWLPDESGLVYNRIVYAYNQTWRIRYADIYRVYFHDLRATHQITIGVYAFSPHVRLKDSTPPISKIEPLPEYSPAEGGIPLKWTVTTATGYNDTYQYTIQAKTNLQTQWQTLQSVVVGEWGPLPEVLGNTLVYQGQPGTTVSFRILAVDHANNMEEKTVPDASTSIYSWKADFAITDPRGIPLKGLQVQSSPASINQPLSDWDGRASLYLSSAADHTFLYQKPGFGAFPAQTVPKSTSPSFAVALPGLDEQLQNGHFDDAQLSLSGWQSSGSLPVTDALGHINGKSAQIGTPCQTPYCLSSPVRLDKVRIDWNLPSHSDLAINQHGEIHFRYNRTQYAVLDENGKLIPQTKIFLSSSDTVLQPMKFDSFGNPYMLTSYRLLYYSENKWEEDHAPLAFSKVWYGMDAMNRLHVLFRGDYSAGFYYRMRETNKQWTEEIMLPYTDSPSSMAVEPNGTIHIVYSQYGLHYIQKRPFQEFDAPVKISEITSMQNLFLEYVPGVGVMLVASDPTHWISMRRAPDGRWSPIPIDQMQGAIKQMRADPAGNVYVLSQQPGETNEGPVQIFLSVYRPGKGGFQSFLAPGIQTPSPLFDVDPQGRPHFISLENQIDQRYYRYSRGSLAASDGAGSLEQTISLPDEMRSPTLSFFYRIESASIDPQSRFQVTFTPTGGQPEPLIDQLAQWTDWRHAWADLSPYLGTTGVLAFHLVQKAGDCPIRVYLDEASVTSWPTPQVSAIDPFPLPVSSSAQWVDIYGHNFWPGAQVRFNNEPAGTVEWISSTHLRFKVPPGNTPGLFRIIVANPNGGEIEKTIQIGSFVMLPSIRK